MRETVTDTMKEHQQKAFSRECISTALLYLMEHKKFHDISITEIVNKAGVSRMAYYRNYESKEDIIKTHLDGIFQGYLYEVSKLEKITVYEFGYLYFSHFRPHSEFLKKIIQSDITILILNQFDQYLQVIFETILSAGSKTLTETQKYEAHYIAGGLYRILIEWAKDDFRVSNEDMAKIFCKIANREHLIW